MIADIVAAVHAAPDQRVPTLRAIRRRVSRDIESEPAAEVLALADGLLQDGRVSRWMIYELVHFHEPAMAALDRRWLERLGEGMASWGEVDPFATYLSGVVWREGRIEDADVHAWARSANRWWRRAALVSTVPLNVRARGGSGDPNLTLAVCELLRSDRDDMVVKALSWALRALAPQWPDAVSRYLDRRRRRIGTEGRARGDQQARDRPEDAPSAASSGRAFVKVCVVGAFGKAGSLHGAARPRSGIRGRGRVP